jgi:parallel beta-helix repeat protein
MFIPPLEKFSYCRVNTLPEKPVSRRFPTGVALPISIFSLTIGLVGTSLNRAMAQVYIGAPTAQNQRTIAQVKLIFVNPNRGNDQAGNGSDRTPYKTITQALQVAQPNTVIMLSPGRYSRETGEVFPMMLKSGVSLQGDMTNKGQGVIIAGGGEYLSRSFGGQNVTIVGANQASIKGVTVSNRNARGYGLWIESTNLLVEENTFTGSTQDGIAIAGSATPSINKNYFYSNGANGITISGSSRPEVRENVFQQTGFGINIAQNAMPVVVGNQITANRSGIIVQANARPILRQNLIQGNREDGLVIIAQAVPDLGSANNPGQNEFRNNSRFDINAKAAKQFISAVGNNLRRDRIAGNVDIQGTSAPITRNPVGSTPSAPISRSFSRNSSLPMTEVPTGGEITFTAPTLPPTNRATTTVTNTNTSQKPLPPLPNNLAPANDSQQVNYVEFVAPQTSTPATTPQRSFTNSGERYRVYIPVANDQQRQIVRSVISDAFNTTWQGRKVMQVGTFSTQENANEVVQILTEKGLRAIVVPVK